MVNQEGTDLLNLTTNKILLMLTKKLIKEKLMAKEFLLTMKKVHFIL
jgi:hypothetical protein